ELSATTDTDPRTNLSPRTLTNVGSGNTAYRVLNSGSCSPGKGWYIDLPDSGERINIDMQVQLGTIFVYSNVPEQNACNVGGYSWLNFFNAQTGCAVSTGGSGGPGCRRPGGGCPGGNPGSGRRRRGGLE